MSANWPRVSDIFAEVINNAPGDRQAYVAGASRGDAEVQAEVMALLEAHDRAGNFLEAPAAAYGEADIEDPANLIGRKLGPYRVDQLLGEGGMGIVLLAEDTRLNRKVALKSVAPALAGDPVRRERLAREAQAAAALSHPNIATVYAFEDIYGQFYIACEYVPGETLRQALKAGPLNLAELAAVARQVARAMAAAHAQGIVHRDLKPENIIRADSGVVKVLDFGIALTPDKDGDGSGRLTSAGVAIGTPAYMSPEQIEGQPVDYRSDQFSFGTVVYELATGSNPFVAVTPLATAGRVIAVDPPALSSRNPALPEALDRIVRRCLEKDRERRYRSTADLVSDLEALAEEKPAVRSGAGASVTPAAPAGDGPLARGWWVLHQYGVMVTYAALVYPIWQVKWWDDNGWTLLLLLLMIAGAAFNGTLRMHLLFTSRFNLPAMGNELRRAGAWVALSDVVVSCVLFGAAVDVASGHTAMAVLLAAFGIGVAAAALMIEPATTRAAFPGLVEAMGAAPPAQLPPSA